MTRRRIMWLILGAFALVAAGVASLVALSRGLLVFLRPRSILEPSTIFNVGRPSDLAVGVDTRFQQSHRVWVVRNADRLYVLYARCTHQGCTPDWAASENKFKCPCHDSRFCLGSAFDADGVNCEGPAPRPLDRVHVELDADGNVIADTNKLYQWPKGQPSQFDDRGAYVSLNQT